MILTKKQSEKLLKELYQDKATGRQRKLAVRNVAMTAFMLEIGLRTTEVVNLSISDLIIADQPVGMLNLARGIPKGHCRRTIPLNDRFRYFVELMNEHWWKPDTGKLGHFAFYDKSPLKHITATQFRRIIGKAGSNALGCPVRPNILRRTCAARLLRITDRQTVQRLLDYKTDQDSFYSWKIKSKNNIQDGLRARALHARA